MRKHLTLMPFLLNKNAEARLISYKLKAESNGALYI